MNMLALTTGLDGTTGGWGRYSASLLTTLKELDVQSVVATPREGGGAYALLPEYGKYSANLLFAPYYAWKLRKAVKDVDLIHAFVEPYACIAAWLSLFSGKPYFVTAHGTYAVMPYYVGFPFSPLHHAAMRGARRIIAVSGYTKRRLEAHGLRNVEAVENGIDFSAFGSDAVVPFAKRENLIVSVGALKRRKGQHLSMAAFVRLAKRFPGLRYCLVGSDQDAAYSAKLKALAEEAGVVDRVEFRTDQMGDAELRALYRKAKAHVLTPVSEGPHFEGFGLVYLEAGAAGTPSVGARDSGAEDALRGGEAGLLVSQGDVAAIENALARLLEDEREWTRVGAAAYENAKAHAWAAVAKAYARLYGLS